MYDAFATQLYTWMHYILAFYVVYIGAPMMLFQKVDGNYADRLLANYARMTFYVISIGYMLVVMKLFEVIGLVCFSLLFIAIRQLRSGAPTKGTGTYFIALLFDLAEFPHRFTKSLHGLPGKTMTLIRSTKGRMRLRIDIRTIRIIMITLVMVTAAAIRLYDAVYVAAPESSDGDVTLAWMKYINERILFHDGIYPQGLYIYMATLYKFAVINALFVVKFTGPIGTFFTVVLMYYTIRQMTNSSIGGIVAAVLYGVIGWHLLGQDWPREAESNSQEFGFLFVFLTVHFLYRYLRQGRRTDYWVALASLCDAGLVHTLAYALAVLAASSMVISTTICEFGAAKRRISASLIGLVASGLISLMPIVLGYALGIHVNSAAGTFLVSSTSSVTLPPLSPFDEASIAGMIFLILFATYRRSRNEPSLQWMVAGIWGCVCFSIYEFGAVVTQSTVLASRMSDLWAISEAFIIGMAAQLVFDLLRRFRYKNIVEILTLGGIVCTVAVYSPPSPIVPYTVQWDDDINAYLRIYNHFRYTDGGYMIVAQNPEYALVLGTGYRMDPVQFLNTYDPTKPPLTRFRQSAIDHKVASNVFIYYYKRIFEVHKSNGIYKVEYPLYVSEKREDKLLFEWLSKFKTANGQNAVKLFYNSRNLQVFEITVPKQKTILGI